MKRKPHRIVLELAKAMRSQQLTQAQLAERADVGQGSLSKTFAGERSPQLEYIERVAEGLGFELVLRKKEEKESS